MPDNMKKHLLFSLLVMCAQLVLSQRISELPKATSVDSTDLMLIVQNGVTKNINYGLVHPSSSGSSALSYWYDSVGYVRNIMHMPVHIDDALYFNPDQSNLPLMTAGTPVGWLLTTLKSTGQAVRFPLIAIKDSLTQYDINIGGHLNVDGYFQFNSTGPQITSISTAITGNDDAALPTVGAVNALFGGLSVPSSLNDLSDVNLGLPATGDVMCYNSAASSWFNWNISGVLNLYALKSDTSSYIVSYKHLGEREQAIRSDFPVNTDNQDLTLSGTTLSLTNDASSVDLSGLNLSTLTFPASNLEYTGEVIYLSFSTSMSFGDLIVFGQTTRDFVKSDCDFSSNMPVFGMVVGSGTGSLPVLLHGFVHNDDWAWTAGFPLFVSSTEGAMVQTAPATGGQYVQVVGLSYYADIIYFNPDFTVIEITAE